MRIRPTVECQTVAVCLLWLGLIRVITAPLALPGLVATTPVRAGKHEVLFAGDAATPHERGDGNQREKRTGNPAQHHFIMPQSGAGGGSDSAFTCACSGWCGDAAGLINDPSPLRRRAPVHLPARVLDGVTRAVYGNRYWLMMQKQNSL